MLLMNWKLKLINNSIYSNSRNKMLGCKSNRAFILFVFYKIQKLLKKSTEINEEISCVHELEDST